MTHENLLDLFESYHKNEDAEWASPSGVLAKQAIAYGIKTVYNKFRNTETGKRMLASKETEVTVGTSITDLPSDLLEVRFFRNSSGMDADHEVLIDGEKRRVKAAAGTYTVRYIPTPTIPTNPTDVVKIPSELEESVCDYALEWYYMWEKNWVERENAITFADKFFNIRSSQIWDNTA